MAEKDDLIGMSDITKNSSVSFERREACLKIATLPKQSIKRMIERSRTRLWKLQTLHDQCSKDEVLDYVLDQVFYQPEGLPHRVYLVDLTFEREDGSEMRRVGIRPQVLPNSFLYRLLGPGKTLRFEGVPNRKEFFIADIKIVTDDEQLPYEATAEILPYKDRNRVGNNFFYDMLDQTDSLITHTANKLKSWEDYLDWKKELAEKGLVGCRYFAVEPGQDQRDKERTEWLFGLIFRNKEDFDGKNGVKRELRNGMQVFRKNYSKDPWLFSYDHEKRSSFQDSWQLGSYHGVKTADYADKKQLAKRYPVLEECPFARPYIVWVRYELSEDDSEAMERSDLSPSEFMSDELLPKLPSDGFLALSAVQDFTLIQRFRQAIGNLKNGVCDSPNLPLWLFDATKARLPRPEDSPEITDWLDPEIAKNQSQKEAVRKMLAAPDLCLVQGPPGTGKTTVIAEAIYQFVKQGKRVLLASQSNDAVDNALERLQKDPVIRAVRMANNERMRKEGGAGYTKDTVLTEFYSSLASKAEKNWLNSWQKRDLDIRSCRDDYRNAMNFEEDLRDLSAKTAETLTELHDNDLEIQNARAAIKQAEDKNLKLRTAGQQFDFLARDVEEVQDDEFLILSKDLLQAMVPQAQRLTESLHTLGLFPKLPDFNDQDIEQAISGKLSLLLRCCHQIPALMEKCRQAAGSGTVDSLELQKIQLQLEDNERQMDALPEDDDDGFRRLRKQAKELKKRRDELQRQSGNLSDSLTEAERAMLSPSLMQSLAGQDGKEILQEALTKGSELSGSTWPLVVEAGRKWLSDHAAADLSDLRERLTIAENHRLTLLDTNKALQRQQQEKEKTLTDLRVRYGSEDSSRASVARSIKDRQNQLEKEQNDDRFRPVWESVLQEYHSRLLQKSAGAEDREIYQRTYLDSCNVVGTSCTANMREFEQYGFEDFDVAIIDEVSKATPPELLLPLMRAHKAILVGDHRQLPPMFGENETSYEAVMNRASDSVPATDGDSESSDENYVAGSAAQASLLTPERFQQYKNMVTASLFKEFFETADDSIKQRLNVQFRMHREIMQVINRFYEYQLQAGLTEQQESTARDHGLTLLNQHHRPFITPEHHAYWMDSSLLPDGPRGTPIYESRRGASTSAINLLEQQMILRLVQRIGEECAAKKIRKTIGIISFYQAQINDLRRKIKSMKDRKELDLSYLQLKNSDINTVDRFQGKEKNIIIVSLVRSKRSHHLGQHTLEFERINVAFSRAQQLLVIVGSQDLFAEQKVTMPAMDKKGTITTNVYGNILKYLSGLGTLLDAGSVLTPEDCEKVRAEVGKLEAEHTTERRRK